MQRKNTLLWNLASLILVAAIWSCKADEKKVIVCWGDSLTAPHSGNGIKGKIKRLITGDYDYPNYLQDMLGNTYEVVNAGVGGENTLTIMARQGAFPMKVAHDVVIDNTSQKTVVGNNDTVAFVSTYNGAKVSPLMQYTWKQDGPSQINPCRIGKSQFLLSSEVRTYENYNYYLTPMNNQGTIEILKKGSIVETHAMRKLRGKYANVFFVGQNGGFKDVSDLIRQIRAMIAYSQSNRYVVISFHKTNHVINTIPRMREMEDSLRMYFGKHYINLREQMVKSGQKYANLVPTKADADSIAKGVVPPQLLADDCHFTTKGYNIIAKLVFERMKELGYISE